MKNESAFPVIVPDGDTKKPGLTKHELAACLIGGHIATTYSSTESDRITPTQIEMIATDAYLLSQAILNKFNPTT